MHTLFSSFAIAAVLTMSSAALATEQTVKLSVPGMSCASCPYMVKDAISMVDGIKSVEATMDDRSATVVYDDAVTSITEIQDATESIGYPSTVLVVEGS